MKHIANCKRGWITWSVTKAGVALAIMILMLMLYTLYSNVSSINSADSANQIAEALASTITQTYTAGVGIETLYELPHKVNRRAYSLEIIVNDTRNTRGIVVGVPGSGAIVTGGAPVNVPLTAYPRPVKSSMEDNVTLLIKSESAGVKITKTDSCMLCIVIDEFHYDGGGPHASDCEPEYINDEYVTFRNVCGEDLNLAGWTVKDKIESRPEYTFKSISLKSREMLVLHTGDGTDTQTDIYWNSTGYVCNAVWNNEGDTLYLKDPEGKPCMEYSYLP